MSVEILSETKPKARKDYNCMACEWFNNSGYIAEEELTKEELAAYKKAEDSNFEIKKGEEYIRQNNKYDGEIYTFRAIPEMHEICIKYDLYDC